MLMVDRSGLPIRTWILAFQCLLSSSSVSNGAEFCTGLSLPLFHSVTDIDAHTHLLFLFSVIVGSVIYCIQPFCFVFICITDFKLFCEIPQDVFPVIPGDTDFRMFAEDYGDIPGLDIIFLRGGYYYHTSFDTVDRILYASFWYI